MDKSYMESAKEEIWDVVKKHKNPTINFGMLHKYVIYNVKKHAQDLF